MIKTKIAVSGQEGSFSEEAGYLYAQKKKIKPEIICATDVEGVLSLLTEGKVDMGFFPVVNSRGGLVDMAFASMGKYLFKVVDNFPFEVHQCLLVRRGLGKGDIKKITTHQQAIAQCQRYIKKEFPQAELIEWKDTAKAAKDLAAGILTDDCAVIAPARAGEIYNLQILEQNIQDVNPNITTFIAVERYDK